MQENYTFARCIENIWFLNIPLFPKAMLSGNSLIKKGLLVNEPFLKFSLIHRRNIPDLKHRTHSHHEHI